MSTWTNSAVDLLSPCIPDPAPVGGIVPFRDATAAMVRAAAACSPDMEEALMDSHNAAPPLHVLCELADRFDGRLSGYVVLNPRDDARVSVDTLTVPVPQETLEDALGNHRTSGVWAQTWTLTTVWWD